MSDELKPAACPFCGHDNVDVFYEGSSDWYVMCGMCTAGGPSEGSKIRAIAAWNTRRPAPEQSGEAQDAARYRYLRARPIGKSVPLITDGIQFIFATRDESRNWVVHSRRGDEMDAAIDAAMDRSALGREET